MSFVLLFARYTIDVFVENDYYTLMQIITGKKYIGNGTNRNGIYNIYLRQ